MAALSIPQGKAVYTTRYTDFKGVDYQSTDECVDISRFSDCDNLMFDKAGLIEKRLGFRCLNQLDGQIHSMKSVNINGKNELLIHAGSKLYKSDGKTVTPIKQEGYKRYSFVFNVPARGNVADRIIRINLFKQGGYPERIKFKSFFAVNIAEEVLKVDKEKLDGMSIEEVEEYYAKQTSSSLLNSSLLATQPDTCQNIMKNSNFLDGLDGWINYGGTSSCEIERDTITLEYEGVGYGIYQDLVVDDDYKAKSIYITFLCSSESDKISLLAEAHCKYVDAVNYEQTEVYQVTTKDVVGESNITEIPDDASSINMIDNKAWITTKDGVFVYDGINVYDAVEFAYAPTTVALRDISYHWRKNNAGVVFEETFSNPGNALEAVNFLTRRRVNTFSLSRFIGTEGPTDWINYTQITVDANIKFVERIEMLDKSGKFITVNKRFYSYTAGENTIKIIGHIYYASGGASGTFACPVPYMLDGVTENLKVYFTATEPTGYEKKVDKCHITSVFGVGKDDRLFLTGNEKYPNYIWYSEFENFGYIPDINYIVTGDGNTKNLGFTKVNQNLLVHKEGNDQDTTVFMVSGSLDSSGKAVFTVTQGINGVGAISEKGFTNFDDMPIFLSDKGVYSVESTNIISEKTVVNRSAYINSELLKHDLKNAAIISYDDMLLVAADGYIYVLYPRKQSYYGKDTVYNAASFEALRWSGLGLSVFCVYDGGLYFGTGDGKVFKWNNDIEGLTKYNDTMVPGGTQTAVKCYFVTKLDDDGSFMTLKTMVKRGCGIMLKPYAQSSVRIFTLTEKEHENQIKDVGFTGAAVLDFDEFWFDVVDFSTRDSGRIIPFNAKVKKYSSLSFRVQNDRLSQGFGVIGIEKRYTVGNYKKY